jgi:hypothetical protein
MNSILSYCINNNLLKLIGQYNLFFRRRLVSMKIMKDNKNKVLLDLLLFGYFYKDMKNKSILEIRSILEDEMAYRILNEN